MLFSAHLADTSPMQALRRKEPVQVPGLRSARMSICAPFSKGVLPRPQLSREAMLACWDDAADLDRFLAEDPTGQVFANGWHVRMEMIRAVGIWPGVEEDFPAMLSDVNGNIDTPTIAVTLGTAYLRTVVPFVRVNSGLEDQFLVTPSGLWGTAMSNLPKRFVATLTIWANTAGAMDYMRTGAHAAAVEAHYDPAVDPTGHSYVTGGGFFGFRPLSESGSVTGKNPLSAGLLATV